MSEREALLRAVCENPDDDTVRLVFADWLEENGEPERAEFIRVQIASQYTPSTMEELWQRVGRECNLWNQFSDRWTAELPFSEAPELDWGRFQRGFAGEMLSINAVPVVGPNRAWIEWNGTDSSGLDWELLFWSAPFTRLYFYHITNWGQMFDRPEVTRLKSVCLYECGVDVNTINPLLIWATQGEGNLLVKQEQFVDSCRSQLEAAFGERFRWKSPWDVY